MKGAFVVTWVGKLREIFPDVSVGSIEGVWESPATSGEDMAIWLDAYEAAAGEPLAFLNMDVDWNRDDWATVVLDMEAEAEARGVPFGVIYNGNGATTNDSWVQETANRMSEYELLNGGTPTQAVFQSWVDLPDRVLPEDEPQTFTHLINRYLGTRPTLTARVDPAASGSVVVGTLTSEAGVGLHGQDIVATAVRFTGQAETVVLEGMAPAGASEATILIRINSEDAG